MGWRRIFIEMLGGILVLLIALVWIVLIWAFIG